MKQIKAKIVPYSSVVGSSVMLLDENGRCIGKVAFMCHSDELRGREVQGWLAETASNAINENETGQQAEIKRLLGEVHSYKMAASECELDLKALRDGPRAKP